MAELVLDASAVLAFVQKEPGSDLVEELIASGVVAISAVNLGEIATRFAERGLDRSAIQGALSTLDLEVHPFDERAAIDAGLLRPTTRHLGLSLGDRACLALGQSLNLPILTADRAWSGLNLGVEIRFIR